MTPTPQPQEAVIPSEGAENLRVDAWLNEREGFGLRIERLVEDLESGADIIPWLRSAFDLGQAYQLQADWVVVPRKAVRSMTMVGCDRLPSVDGVFGVAGALCSNVWDAMVEEGERLFKASNDALSQSTCGIAPLGDEPKPSTREAEAPVSEAVDLRDACQRMVDDYQTSDIHHPNHVLVCAEAFYKVRDMLGHAAWKPIETAPKDGTLILTWCVHVNAEFCDDAVAEGYAAPVIAKWIDHNGGGFTWHGLAGTHTHWMPLPTPPATEGAGE